MALNSSPPDAMTSARRSAVVPASVVASARRYWWASALILLVVALVAGARYFTAPQSYLATKELTIALVPGQALGDPGNPALSTSGVRAVAHSIASSGLVNSAAFADAILARIPSDQAQREHMTPGGIEQALTATDQGAQVRLQARWPSQAGARAVVTAAILALQTNPPTVGGALSPGDTLSMQAPQATPNVEQDSVQQSANASAFWQQLAIGLGLALILPWIFAGLARRRL
jgi:hypothetical protein